MICTQCGGVRLYLCSLLHVSRYDAAEQAEVESYFISTGRLLPNFHHSYWLGLRAAAGSAGFRWVTAAGHTHASKVRTLFELAMFCSN